MKEKTKGIILSVVVIISLITIFIHQPIEIKRDIFNNTRHKNDEIQLIMNEAVEFISQDGITVTRVHYDGKESQETENRLINDYGYQDAIVVYLEFHTGFFNIPSGFIGNYHASGYQYVCIKNNQDIWELHSVGYG